MGFLEKFLVGSRRWSDIERFEPGWRDRISQMASHISAEDKIVVDLGCGPGWLKDYLPEGIRYIGVDYKKRGEDCVVCDFNRGQFPDTEAAVYFLSGCLEYIDEPGAFIEKIAGKSRKCIVSYCGLEHFSDIQERRKRGWMNHLNCQDIEGMFGRCGMKMSFHELTQAKNSIYVFVRGNK